MPRASPNRVPKGSGDEPQRPSFTWPDCSLEKFPVSVDMAASAQHALRHGAAGVMRVGAALVEAGGVAHRYAERVWGAERTLIAVGESAPGDALYTVPRLQQFIREEPDMHTLQVGRAEHLDFAQALPAASLTHHQCDPNGNLMCVPPVATARSLLRPRFLCHFFRLCSSLIDGPPAVRLIRSVDDDGVTFVARRHIADGEILSFDYNTCDWLLASPFECQCGSDACVGSVRGYSTLSAGRRAELAPRISPVIRALAEQAGLSTAAEPKL